MLSTIIIAAVAGALTGTTAAISKNRTQAANDTLDAVTRYNEVAKQYGLDKTSTNDLITSLYLRGDLDVEEYKKAIQYSDEAQKAFGNGSNTVEDWWHTLTHTGKTHDSITKLYNILADKLPELKIDTENITDVNSAINQLTNKIPEISGVAAPNYYNPNFEGEQLEVDPVKLWTGQELADLHNIDYNPETYYDLIKQGTEANVDYGNYVSEQMNQASMVDDVKNRTSYLDSLRNTKAEAIATGATLGARAANEVLANKEALNNYAANQASVAEQRYNTLDSLLQADAQAKLNANDYFLQLAQSLAGDSMTLYANDTDRYGQELLTNAELYDADQTLRGEYLKANANMNKAFNEANASINLANAGANTEANEYDWVFNNFLRANGGNALKAYLDMDSYIYNAYTGKTDVKQHLGI